MEELQARIYTEASGRPASADEIRARYKDQKKDLKTTRYALTEDGEPLAYVQATDSTSQVGKTHISYPWAMPSCPVEVQEKIFDDLLAYLKQRKETLEITSPIVVDSLNIKDEIQQVIFNMPNVHDIQPLEIFGEEIIPIVTEF